MLIDIRISELQTETNNGIFLGFFTGILYYNIIKNNLNTNNVILNNINLEGYNNIKISLYNI
jgi:hypothetical protein